MKEKIERVKGALQIEEDIDLHITGWIIQRIGWMLMLIFLILAALGLFGNGMLSDREIIKDGTTLVYEQFSRYENDTKIQIDALSAKGKVYVKVPRNFTDSHKIEAVTPEPETQRLINGDTEFIFTSQGGGKVIFFVSPRMSGRFAYTFNVNGSEFSLRNFIYP